MRTTEFATRLNSAIEHLKVRRNVLATADLLSQAAVDSVAEIRAVVTELEVLAIDLANTQREAARSHRSTLEC
ncbi:hypothetical protein R0290_10085 [Burkholderia semiarida]|uniref:hypothetical protein n=1 Tax=Burkholderia TaxID=32008 RepID=UPI00265DB6CD|nr:hypothetical protein [Burkholderia sp. AU44665]MDN7699468.1 hypothetical protein [Burkholderia sp. AU44665]